MFDVIRYAMDNNISLHIMGVGDPNLIGVVVEVDNIYIEKDILMVKQPDETDDQYSGRLKAFLDRIVSRIRAKQEQYVENFKKAQQRAELESFFREDTQ